MTPRNDTKDIGDPCGGEAHKPYPNEIDRLNHTSCICDCHNNDPVYLSSNYVQTDIDKNMWVNREEIGIE